MINFQMALILGDAIEQFTKSLRKPKLKQARFKKSRRSTKSNDYQPLRRSGRIQKTGHHRPYVFNHDLKILD